jgi:hypothetical protein
MRLVGMDLGAVNAKNSRRFIKGMISTRQKTLKSNLIPTQQATQNHST